MDDLLVRLVVDNGDGYGSVISTPLKAFDPALDAQAQLKSGVPGLVSSCEDRQVSDLRLTWRKGVSIVGTSAEYDDSRIHLSCLQESLSKEGVTFIIQIRLLE